MVAATHLFIGHQVKGGHSCERILPLKHLTPILFLHIATGLLTDLKSKEEEITEDLLAQR
jgi:hypothetical protein